MKRRDKDGNIHVLYHAVFERVGEEEKQITRWETDKGRTLKSFNNFVKAAGLSRERNPDRNFFMRHSEFVQPPKETSNESPSSSNNL